MIKLFFWLNETALLVSAFIFTGLQEKRDNFIKRIIASAALFTLVSSQLLMLISNNIIDAGIAVRLSWFLMLVLVSKFCWKIKWSCAFYYSMWSFITWQLLYELWYMIVSVSRIDPLNLPSVIGNVVIFIIGYGIVYATIAKWISDDIVKVGPRQLISGMLIFWIFEIIAMAQRRTDITAGDSKWALLYLTQVLIAVVLYLQNELFKKSALRQELSIINLLHKKEHEQYELSKENIELINRKCHDLKHQIRAIRNMDKEDIDKYLEEVENSVRIYESIAKTGNEVLDTILTEKSLYCTDHNITVSCVADGSQMHFINTVDLYSLLGNALDNAIEAVEKFTDKDKRIIDVLIYRQQQFLAINITNPAPEVLEYMEEIPVTTKEDKDYHGYGIKSMKYIVKKYNGFLNIKEENGLFCLKILIPIP